MWLSDFNRHQAILVSHGSYTKLAMHGPYWAVIPVDRCANDFRILYTQTHLSLSPLLEFFAAAPPATRPKLALGCCTGKLYNMTFTGGTIRSIRHLFKLSRYLHRKHKHKTATNDWSPSHLVACFLHFLSYERSIMFSNCINCDGNRLSSLVLLI